MGCWAGATTEPYYLVSTLVACKILVPLWQITTWQVLTSCVASTGHRNSYRKQTIQKIYQQSGGDPSHFQLAKCQRLRYPLNQRLHYRYMSKAYMCISHVQYICRHWYFSYRSSWLVDKTTVCTGFAIPKMSATGGRCAQAAVDMRVERHQRCAHVQNLSQSILYFRWCPNWKYCAKSWRSTL